MVRAGRCAASLAFRQCSRCTPEAWSDVPDVLGARRQLPTKRHTFPLRYAALRLGMIDCIIKRRSIHTASISVASSKAATVRYSLPTHGVIHPDPGGGSAPNLLAFTSGWENWGVDEVALAGTNQPLSRSALSCRAGLLPFSCEKPTGPKRGPSALLPVVTE